MGVVHEAHSLSAGRRVAVKVLHRELASDMGIVGRFVQERQILERVEHDNVVRVEDLVVDLGQVGIVMEHVQGQDLKQLLAARSLEPAEALTLATQLAAGLQAIHGDGIVHRDLKPGNILVATGLGSAPVPKITDFGISHLVDRDQVVKSFAGTPSYMAPEAMVEGTVVGPTFDIYTLGLIVYELLVGERPFLVEGSMAAMLAHRDASPPSIGGVPAELASLVDRMLDKRPEGRPGAAEVVTALSGVASELDPDQRPHRVEPAARPPVRPSSPDRAERGVDSAGASETAAPNDEVATPPEPPRPPASSPDGVEPPAAPAAADANELVLRRMVHGSERPVTEFVALARRAELSRAGVPEAEHLRLSEPPRRGSTFAALAREEASRRRQEGEPARPAFDITAARSKDRSEPSSASAVPSAGLADGTRDGADRMPSEPAASSAAADPVGRGDGTEPVTVDRSGPPDDEPGAAPGGAGGSPEPGSPRETGESPTSAGTRAAGRARSGSAWSWRPDIEGRQLVLTAAAAVVALVVLGVMVIGGGDDDEWSGIELLATDVETRSTPVAGLPTGGSDGSSIASDEVGGSESNRSANEPGGRASYSEGFGSPVPSVRPSLPASATGPVVPEVVGLPAAAAEAALAELDDEHDLDLVVVLADGLIDRTFAGRVTRAQPAPGTTLSPGDVITLWVAAAPPGPDRSGGG